MWPALKLNPVKSLTCTRLMCICIWNFVSEVCNPLLGLAQLPLAHDRLRRYPCRPFRARSSAVEHYLDMVGVTGSIPVARTMSSLAGGE